MVAAGCERALAVQLLWRHFGGRSPGDGGKPGQHFREPKQVVLPEAATQLASRDIYSVALTARGHVYHWGHAMVFIDRPIEGRSDSDKPALLVNAGTWLRRRVN